MNKENETWNNENEKEEDKEDEVYSDSGDEETIYRCDAEECICPEGREADKDGTIWEINLCWCCNPQGIHFKCGNIPLTTYQPDWKCKDCIDKEKASEDNEEEVELFIRELKETSESRLQAYQAYLNSPASYDDQYLNGNEYYKGEEQ